MKRCFFALLIFFFTLTSVLCGQSTQTIGNMLIGTSIEPIKIIANTDSSFFVLGKKQSEKGEWDFYISKHTYNKKGFDFSVCLELTKVFKGGINPNSDNFEFTQGKENIVLLFTAVNKLNKILFGKIIEFNGNISESFVIHKTDYTDENLESCEYKSFSTNKKNIFVHNQVTFKSGFRRDKGILLDPFCNKIWEYDFPQLNGRKEENVIVDIDNANQLIYYPWQFTKELTFDYNGNITNAVKVYSNDEIRDTVIAKKIGNANFHLKMRKDSIKFFFVNPNKKEVTQKAMYYPFVTMPVVRSLTSSQLLMYSMVDLDDEKYIQVGKKALYYKRFDLKSGNVLLDTLVVLDNATQMKLMHDYAIGKRPTAKYFRLLSENMVGGKMVSVYEHNFNGQFLELFSSCYSITDNKLEWACLLPRKINFYYPNLYDLIVRAYDGKTSVSFFEHKKNLFLNNRNYDFKRYKLLRKPKHKVLVSYEISPNGDVAKYNYEIVNDDFLFPWLINKQGSKDHFFFSRDFFPVDFLLNRN